MNQLQSCPLPASVALPPPVRSYLSMKNHPYGHIRVHRWTIAMILSSSILQTRAHLVMLTRSNSGGRVAKRRSSRGRIGATRSNVRGMHQDMLLRASSRRAHPGHTRFWQGRRRPRHLFIIRSALLPMGQQPGLPHNRALSRPIKPAQHRHQ